MLAQVGHWNRPWTRRHWLARSRGRRTKIATFPKSWSGLRPPARPRRGRSTIPGFPSSGSGPRLVAHTEADPRLQRSPKRPLECTGREPPLVFFTKVSMQPGGVNLPTVAVTTGLPRHSHQWAAEALSSVGSRGTHISGQPRHSHQRGGGLSRDDFGVHVRFFW